MAKPKYNHANVSQCKLLPNKSISKATGDLKIDREKLIAHQQVSVQVLLRYKEIQTETLEIHL